MRNIFIFLWRSYFFLLFLLLEVASFYLIVQNNNYQRASFINSTNALSATLYGYKTSITQYVNLKPVSETLARENALLRSQTATSFYNNYVKQVTIKDSLFKQQYTYITAKVINNSVSHRNNYLTLNRGNEHGIKPGMGVISSNGIVGIVKDVSQHYCTVLSVLHSKNHISAKIASSEYFGSLVWEGGDCRYATLMDIPKHVQLKEGDRIVTTSYSSIFPEGITIGSIASFEVKPGDNFYTIKVLLSTNFQNITYVYVVNNIMKEEQAQLEQNEKNDQ